MNKNILIIVIIIIIIAIVGVFVFSNSNGGKLNTQINFLSESTLKNGDQLEFELKDSQGNALAGETINITYNNNEKYSLVTDENGKGYLTINGEPAGNVEVSIDYGGNDKYNGCSAKTTITIEDGETALTTTTNVNSTASTVKYNNQTSSSSSESGDSNANLYYDKELNVYYDSNGIVRGGQSDGSTINKLREDYSNPNMIDEEGNLQ